MTWSSIFRPPWIASTPATEESIQSIAKAAAPLPKEYVELLQWSNGGEGPLGEVYFSLWPAEDVVKRNEGYEIGRVFPNAIAIGDDSSHFYAFEFDQMEAIRFPIGYMHPSAINARLPSLKLMMTKLANGELF
jgi:hypothetical protein